MLGIALAFAASVAQLAIAQPAAMDFIAHYAAASLVLSGRGDAILDPEAGLAAERAAAPERERLLPLLQVPALALIRAPIALLPFEAAFALMAAIDVALIVASVALLAPRDRFVTVLLLASPPAVIAVAHAQTSPLALLLLALGVRLGARGAGLALGLTLLRIQSAPLLVLAGLVDPARRAWTLAGALLVVAASAAVVGVEGLARYAGTLVTASDILRTGEVGMRAAIGWSGLGLALGLPQLGLVVSAVSLAIGAVVVTRASPDARPAVAGAWSLLATPNLLLHDAILAFPILVALASRRSPWDAASILAWLAHALLVPVGALWSAVLAVAAIRRT